MKVSETPRRKTNFSSSAVQNIMNNSCQPMTLLSKLNTISRPQRPSPQLTRRDTPPQLKPSKIQSRRNVGLNISISTQTPDDYLEPLRDTPDALPKKLQPRYVPIWAEIKSSKFKKNTTTT